MKQLAHLSLLLFSIIAISACDANDDDANDDDASESQVFNVEDVYGIWEADSVMWGPNEVQGLELTLTENRILAKHERVVNPETNEILEQTGHTCLSYTDLSVDDEVTGEYTFHGLVNLSSPSSGAEDVEFDLSDDGQVAQLTTEADNGEGGLILVQYEMQRTASTGSIDDTSCVSQE